VLKDLMPTKYDWSDNTNQLEFRLHSTGMAICRVLGFKYGACAESAIATALVVGFNERPKWVTPILEVSV
jgi:hypothetical protein